MISRYSRRVPEKRSIRINISFNRVQVYPLSTNILSRKLARNGNFNEILEIRIDFVG